MKDKQSHIAGIPAVSDPTNETTFTVPGQFIIYNPDHSQIIQDFSPAAIN